MRKMNRFETPFKNDPFAILCKAFRNLYPEKEYECVWDNRNMETEEGTAYGLTQFSEDRPPRIEVNPELQIFDAVEILGHELAHVAVGVEHEHDEVWEQAFDSINREYVRIGDELFDDRITKDASCWEDEDAQT